MKERDDDNVTMSVPPVCDYRMDTDSTPLSVPIAGVNNGVSVVTAQAGGAGGAGIRRVLITPLAQPVQVLTKVQRVIDKVILKAVTKTGKTKQAFHPSSY